MTRIYEALEQFDLEHCGGSEYSGEAAQPITLPQVIKKDNAVTPELTETLIGLYRTIFNSVPGSDGRIIQFVESGKGFECSNLIYKIIEFYVVFCFWFVHPDKNQ